MHGRAVQVTGKVFFLDLGPFKDIFLLTIH